MSLNRPGLQDALSFWCRSRLLILRRLLGELMHPSTRRWTVGDRLANAPVIVERRTALWGDGREDEFALTAGKVHNLRTARVAFDGIEVSAGETLSFWRQLGRPSAARGFVEGREVRKGCVVPTVAGGICQLSNAIATVAAAAGMELVERHAHSARIDGATTDPGAIDATVFWNYIDLRVRAKHDWRLEVDITSSDLLVRLRGTPDGLMASRRPLTKIPLVPERKEPAGPPQAKGCLTCNETACFRHRPAPARPAAVRTAVLVDAWSPEFADYLIRHHPTADYFLPVPMRVAFWRGLDPGWNPQVRAAYRAHWAGLRRTIWRVVQGRRAEGRRQAGVLDAWRWLAHAYAKRLSPLHTKLVVAQELLPHLELAGVLGGRQVEVLASALPLATLHERLDAAALRWPGEYSLREFRAGQGLVDAEASALAKAAAVVTAHSEVATLLTARHAAVTSIPWQPVRADAARLRQVKKPDGAPLILFPSSPLARKGVREFSAALEDLACRVRFLGKPLDVHGQGQHLSRLDVEYCQRRSQCLVGVDLVVLPAYVEHQPRMLLAALAAGIPVIATSACGVPPQPRLHLVAGGDVAELRRMVLSVLTGSEPSAHSGTRAKK